MLSSLLFCFIHSYLAHKQFFTSITEGPNMFRGRAEKIEINDYPEL